MQAKIDADHRLVFALWPREVALHRDGQKPMIRDPRHDAIHDLAGEAQGFRHAHPAEFRNVDALPINRKFAVVNGETVMDAAPFEAGKLCPLRKEICKGSVEIPKRAFGSALCHVTDPRERRAFDGIELRFETERGRLAAGAILRLPFRSRPIIDEPRRAAGFFEIRHLFRRGRESDLMRQCGHLVHVLMTSVDVFTNSE